ncbi:BLUF domain-containing protein [Sphingomonas sp. CFBP 13720]|uniref:BLUF domain-containing protein n=1 Tax=Sphingomonas sp. CFBP 13720 TaxID=2775302 RepID=UPI00201743E5|nr:BLUF domain-containing protein [Sphingomonas sp. CFBP 13720]
MTVQDRQLRQIFYHSRAVPGVDIGPILASAKRNNGIDGITGLMLFDGHSFLQVLEGSEDSVAAAFERIRPDPRHTDVTVISDHLVPERDFAYWSMELRDPAHPSDDSVWRLRRRLEQFNPDFHHYFFDGSGSPSDVSSS